MAMDPLSAASGIIGIVAFGMQLATTLQTYMELTIEANEALHDIVFDINATASTLKQLQDIIDDDKEAAMRDSRRHVFQNVTNVEVLALKCKKVYVKIIELVLKASGSNRRPPTEIPRARARRARRHWNRLR